MLRVHRLSPEIANQIAAGEVIERPANAVKELVENALDAGARRIEVDIESGGKKLIRVRDDGLGMNGEDAVLALQRHATSKLQSIDDLYAIRTLGFRGEALPSIAAVSRFTLLSRDEESEAATRLEVEGGFVQNAENVASTRGTEIQVRDLFFNVPARFKFLKSDSAEAARINEMIGHLALSHPEVAFRLHHNGNEMLRVDGGGNALNAVACVLGRETARAMLPIGAVAEGASTRDENGIAVTGFAGRPQLTRGNRNAQLFFVNGRIIKNRSLQHAVQAAYEGLLHGRDRFPVVVLFIEMPAGAVDVNVHPTKSEVRFAREWEVHHAARVALRETLVAAQLAPAWGLNESERGAVTGPFGSAAPGENGATSFPGGATSAPNNAPHFFPVAPRGGDLSAFRAAQNLSPQSYAPREYSQAAPHENDAQNAAGAPNASPHPLADALYGAPSLPGIAEESAPRFTLKPLAQISHNAYILCEGDDGLYIVCQHRAHERILADKAIAAAEGRPVEAQRLVIPFTCDAGPRALAAVEENADLLKHLGFEVEAFGGNSLLVRSVPTLVSRGDYETAFSDLLEELVSGHAGRGLQEKRRALLTMLSCKNAIKAGDALQMPQMQNLCDELLQLENPSICPHGQPILIKISTLELDKKFEREYASR